MRLRMRTGRCRTGVGLADDRPGTPDSLPVLVPAAIADRTAIVTLEGCTRRELPDRRRAPATCHVNSGWVILLRR
jgi:hypothetical protein